VLAVTRGQVPAVRLEKVATKDGNKAKMFRPFILLALVTMFLLMMACHKHPKEAYELGRKDELGQGVPQDYGKSAHWYRLTTKQGLADVQSNLGVLYDNDYGVS